MSLRKIWNSLCGRSENSDTTANPETIAAQPAAPAAPRKAAEVAVAPTATTAPATAKPATRRTASRPAAPVVAEAKPAATAPQITPPKRSVLSMLSRGEHDALLKIVGDKQPTSILEIGVGDGSRMPAILAMLDQSEIEQGVVKAIVIDEFELGSGDVAMRDYHRQLAGLTIRPVIFPESVGRGLVNVAHRFGAIDLILVDAKTDETNSEALASFLGKVTHSATTVLTNTTGKWTTRQTGSEQTRRAA